MVPYVCKHLGPFKEGFPHAFEVIGVSDKREAETIRRVIATLNDVEQSKIVCVDKSGNTIPYTGPAISKPADSLPSLGSKPSDPANPRSSGMVAKFLLASKDLLLTGLASIL